MACLMMAALTSQSYNINDSNGAAFQRQRGSPASLMPALRGWMQIAFPFAAALLSWSCCASMCLSSSMRTCLCCWLRSAGMALGHTLDLNSCLWPTPVYGTIKIVACCSRGAQVKTAGYGVKHNPRYGLPAVLMNVRSPGELQAGDCARTS